MRKIFSKFITKRLIVPKKNHLRMNNNNYNSNLKCMNEEDIQGSADGKPKLFLAAVIFHSPSPLNARFGHFRVLFSSCQCWSYTAVSKSHRIMLTWGCTLSSFKSTWSWLTLNWFELVNSLARVMWLVQRSLRPLYNPTGQLPYEVYEVRSQLEMWLLYC